MRNTARFLFLSLAAALSASVFAQERAQDFTLPEPTPSRTPQPQGPVDDSGIIPVAPRVIPTGTPTPVPSPSTTPTPIQSPVSRPIPAPANSPAPRPVARPPAPNATSTPAPVATVPAPQPGAPLDTSPPAEPAMDQGISASELPTLPSANDSDNSTASVPAASETPSSGDLSWTYWLAGLLAAMAAVGGFLFWNRRRENALPPPIKRPVVDAALDQVGSSVIPPRFDLAFEVEGITRSLMAVMVSGRVVVKNRGERAIRDIRLLAELTSAHHPDAKTPGNLGEICIVERVGPHQTHREKVSFRLPIDQILGIRRDGIPFFVPLVRVEAAIDGADPRRLDLVLGSIEPGTGQKLQPLRLDGPPGAYNNLQGHPLTA
ncbi:hypothetical protein [Altererythrobacter sp. GH1-8]|uniref:hypothetical protein n=1 Tax=Altererythrobacter sp. GH1-8 TaxID=3349333 RepID=UPI00374D40DD